MIIIIIIIIIIMMIIIIIIIKIIVIIIIVVVIIIKKIKHNISLKSCYSGQLLFSLAFILSHTVKFLLDLINQHNSLLSIINHKIHLHVKSILN